MPNTNTKPQSAGHTHTRETWHVNAIDSNGRITGDETSEGWEKLHINGLNCTVARVYRAADARRIVACVNACEGVPDAMLFGAGSIIPTITHKTICLGIRTERDALRERVRALEGALRTVQMAINEALTGFPRPITDYKDVVNAALRGQS